MPAKSRKRPKPAPRRAASVRKARSSAKSRTRPASKPAKRPKSRGKSSKSSAAGAFMLFHVDAFTARLFHGNPAAVVPLERWLPDDALQSIAAENNLAETAFIVPRGKKNDRFDIRWFTPAIEMDLCGHATLAAAHVLWNHMGVRANRIIFESRSGPLPVTHDRKTALLTLDFPSRPARRIKVTEALCAALGHEPSEVYQARDILAVLDNRRDVYNLQPDMAALAKLDALGVIVTAPGSGHDFVSRFFAPRAGVNEDPVTGSAHCTLVPYWAARLGKKHLVSHQVSHRGGELWCELKGDRVLLGGHCVTYSVGSFILPKN